MGIGDKLSNSFFGIVILFIAGIVLFLGYVVYGSIFISKTISTTVVNEEVSVSHSMICQMVGKVSVCTPMTSTNYYVFTNEKRFSTSSDIYYRITVGKKYVFRLAGWDCCQSISEIVEEGK